jgi:hypothetical protein
MQHQNDIAYKRIWHFFPQENLKPSPEALRREPQCAAKSDESPKEFGAFLGGEHIAQDYHEQAEQQTALRNVAKGRQKITARDGERCNEIGTQYGGRADFLRRNCLFVHGSLL